MAHDTTESGPRTGDPDPHDKVVASFADMVVSLLHVYGFDMPLTDSLMIPFEDQVGDTFTDDKTAILALIFRDGADCFRAEVPYPRILEAWKTNEAGGDDLYMEVAARDVACALLHTLVVRLGTELFGDDTDEQKETDPNDPK